MKHFHGKHLRKGRHSERGRVYLITTVTHQRKNLFTDWQSAQPLIREIRTVTAAGLATSLTCVIMPDHLHWLVIPEKASLSNIIRQVKSRSAIAFNKLIDGTGQVWQKGFHDHAVRDGEDIRAVSRYIITNPLRAGLVNHIGEYPLWDAIWL